MSAEPAGAGPAEEPVVTVPLGEYRRLRALEQLASPDELERAAASAAAESHREWVAAGRPRGIPHADVRRMLLGGT